MKLVFVLTLLCFSFSCFTYGEEKAVIGYVELPQVLDSTNQYSPYNKLMKKLLSRIGTPYRTLFIPTGRSNAMLNQGSIDCAFPVLPGGHQRTVKTIFSDTLNKVTTHLFSLKGTKITSLNNIGDKVIIYDRTAFFGQLFERHKHIEFIPVGSQEIAINMLLKGRADAYLAYYPDIKLSLDKQRYQQLLFSKEHPITRSNDKLECAANEKNKTLVSKFNSELQKMKKSGELEQTLGEYFNF